MINKIILVGNVGKDPEIRQTQSGGKIASFSLATTEYWKDKESGEKKLKTEWHKIAVLNNSIANMCEKYLFSGDKVYLEGQLQSRKYTGNDGVEKSITEVIVKPFSGTIKIVSSKNKKEKLDDNIDDDIENTF